MFNNLLAIYYQKKKEKLHKSAREIYQDFPGEEKLKKTRIRPGMIGNLLQDEKQRLVKYRMKCKNKYKNSN